MPAQKLREFLDSQNVKYKEIPHEVSFTAKQTANLTHVPKKDLAKTVIVKIDGELAMAVLPASYGVDLAQLHAAIGGKSVSLAKETDFKDRFPECEVGAMPPFGNLYGMDVYVDESLTKDVDISFNAGSHYELMQISYADFERLVKPKILNFACLQEADLVGAWHI